MKIAKDLNLIIFVLWYTFPENECDWGDKLIWIETPIGCYKTETADFFWLTMNEFWRGFDLGRSLFCWKSAKSLYFCLWHIDRRESVSLFSTANLENSDEYGNKRCYSYVLEKGRGLMLILVFGLFQSLPYKIGCRRHAFFVYFSYVWKIIRPCAGGWRKRLIILP